MEDRLRHAVDDLLQRIDSLRTAPSSTVPGARKRHQPLTLLWAIGRAVQGKERLVPWKPAYREVGRLIEDFGLDGDRPNVEFPVLQLHHDGLWDLPGHTDPPIRGHQAQQWMRRHRPDGGLQPWVYDIVIHRADVRAQIVLKLLDTYFEGIDQNALLTRVGLGLDTTETGDEAVLPEGTPTPERREVTRSQVARDSPLALQIKLLYGHHCQICATRLVLPRGCYAEGAHIRPLGRPHNGPDESGNLLCLCPNHHVLFDHGAITVQDDLTVTDVIYCDPLGTLRLAPGHHPKPEHLAYHRKAIAGRR